MKAFQFKAWSQPADLVDVPVPEPGPGEVLIRIGGAGVYHSDLHVMYHWSPEGRSWCHEVPQVVSELSFPAAVTGN